MTIAFVAHVPEAVLDDYMDMVRRRIDRARAHNMLVEAMIDLASTEEALASWGMRKAKAISALVAERARLMAFYTEANETHHRRSSELSPRQKSDLDQFRAKIEEEEKKFDDEKNKLEANLPIYRDRFARQRAIIAGAERADMVGFHAEVVAAAE